MSGLLFILLFWIAPIFVSARTCQMRNRNPWKGAFVGVFFGWVGAACLWLALRPRNDLGYLM